MKKIVASLTVCRYIAGVTNESIVRLHSKLKGGPYDTDVVRFHSNGDAAMRLSARKKKCEEVFEQAVLSGCERTFDQAVKLEEEWKKLLEEGQAFYREAEKTQSIIDEG